MHSFSLSLLDLETKRKYEQNAEIVRTASTPMFEIELQDAAEELQTEYPQDFPRLSHQIETLFSSMDDINYAFEPMENVPQVLCHGNLSTACLSFDDKSGQLVTIRGWDVSMFIF